MAKASLRSAALSCVAAWAAVWLLFLLLRTSSLDVSNNPGAGRLLLGALAALLVQVLVFSSSRWL